MPRIARAVIAGVPHHVTQRGNRREDVFFSNGDRKRYLELLREYSEKHDLEILAFCLMSNHVHLVVRPQREESLAGTLKPVDLRYAQHVNWTQHLSGRLWQGRYFSCALDDEHYRAAVRYVERNPVRAGLVKRAEDYRWSSAAAHCGRVKSELLMRDERLEAAVGDWSAWLAGHDDAEMMLSLRARTRTGRPAGNARFIARVERMLGRVLRAKRVGRPRKGK